MDQSTQTLSGQLGDQPSSPNGDNEQNEGLYGNLNRDKQTSLDSLHLQRHDESVSRADDRSGRNYPTVDVAEILRRWTHALQRIHKQSLQLVCFFLFVFEVIVLLIFYLIKP